jgi:hypothetical protein
MAGGGHFRMAKSSMAYLVITCLCSLHVPFFLEGFEAGRSFLSINYCSIHMVGGLDYATKYFSKEGSDSDHGFVGEDEAPKEPVAQKQVQKI